jgi:LysR family glycine cleavage system transcriptional activator
MALRLPSLNVLIVFEAAARHLSFKHAADELCLSPPAISHQIKVLETHLNKRLFKRLNRALELTHAGQIYYEDIRGALAELHQATDRMMGDDEKTIFQINSIPFITNTLLIPHIQPFRDNNPNLRISIKSQTQRTDFTFGATDVAIRHQKGDEPNLHYELLSPVFIAPICSPDYLKTRPSLQLNDLKIIRLESDQYSWPYWINKWNKGRLPEEELCLDNYQAVLEAVKQGVGLAMGYFPSLIPMLEQGDIVLPFDKQISEFDHLYLVYSETNKQSSTILSFQLWIKQLIHQLLSDKNILFEPQ